MDVLHVRQDLRDLESRDRDTGVVVGSSPRGRGKGMGTADTGTTGTLVDRGSRDAWWSSASWWWWWWSRGK